METVSVDHWTNAQKAKESVFQSRTSVGMASKTSFLLGSKYHISFLWNLMIFHPNVIKKKEILYNLMFGIAKK